MTTHSVCQPGPPVAPGRRPRRLARLGLLPQREVDRRALVLVRLDPGAGPQRLDRLAGEQPVVVDPAGLEVHAVGGLVGHAAVDEVGDQLDHAVDVARWHADRRSGA